MRARFLPGKPSSSSLASSSGQAQGTRPARKLEQVSRGSRFRTRSLGISGASLKGEEIGRELLVRSSSRLKSRR